MVCEMTPISRARAEELAVAALLWLASDAERVSAFLNASGAAPGDLRERAMDPEFLAFVMDFLLSDDANVLEFSQSQGIDPLDVQRSKAALPGGELPHFT